MEPSRLKDIPTKADMIRIKDLLNLTDRQRTIFELKYERGLSFYQIADVLGMSYPRVSAESCAINKKLAYLKYDEIMRINEHPLLIK